MAFSAFAQSGDPELLGFNLSRPVGREVTFNTILSGASAETRVWLQLRPALDKTEGYWGIGIFSSDGGTVFSRKVFIPNNFPGERLRIIGILIGSSGNPEEAKQITQIKLAARGFQTEFVIGKSTKRFRVFL